MNRRSLIITALLLILLSGSAGYLAAQQERSGIRSEVLAQTDLAPHFSCMEGMELKMTRHEVDPGKGGGEHSHLGRPEVFYVLDGSIVEHQGGTSTTYTAGQGFVSNADHSVPHRIENAGDTVATVMDIQVVSTTRE